MTENRNTAGIISLCLGVLVFSMQDAILKSLSGDYAVTQAVAIRCVVALPLLGALVHWEVGIQAIFSANWRALALRGLTLLVAYTCYFMALPSLPLAQAVALSSFAPIFITIMSGPMLGERIRMGSWLALIVGFAGVLLIVQPGTAVFEPASLLSLTSAAAYAFSMILARRLGVDESATVMSFYQNVVYLAGAIVLALAFNSLGIEKAGHPSIDFLVRPWVLPQVNDFLLMGLCGVIAAAGMMLLTHAYRISQASSVTVFEYTTMIWGPMWGFVVFHEVPSWLTIAGMLLIVAAGVYSIYAAAAMPALGRDQSN